jgi:L-lactate dehydrogenase (cytochrome)
VQDNLDRAKAAGSKAIVFTIDAPATSTRHRAARFSTTNANADTATLTWALYAQLRNMTSLPIILKGITTIHDVRKAISHGAPAIYVSNHGGRQLDGSPSPLEICLEIYEQDPSLFQKIEIYADSGVRYGTDVLKLLALGVRAVGLGRPFMYANAYGVDGVMQLIELLKTEIAADAANAGIANVQMISRERVNWKPLTSNGF